MCKSLRSAGQRLRVRIGEEDDGGKQKGEEGRTAAVSAFNNKQQRRTRWRFRDWARLIPPVPKRKAARWGPRPGGGCKPCEAWRQGA